MLGRDTDPNPDSYSRHHANPNANAADHTNTAASDSDATRGNANAICEPDRGRVANPGCVANPGRVANTGRVANAEPKCDPSRAGPQPLDSDASSDRR